MSIVKEYDRRMLYSIVKSYNHLHPIGDVAFGSTNQDADEDYGLNFF